MGLGLGHRPFHLLLSLRHHVQLFALVLSLHFFHGLAVHLQNGGLLGGVASGLLLHVHLALHDVLLHLGQLVSDGLGSGRGR